MSEMTNSSLKYPIDPVWEFPKVTSLPDFFNELGCLQDKNCFVCLEIPIEELKFTPSLKLIVSADVPLPKSHTTWPKTTLLPILITPISIEALVLIAKDSYSQFTIHHITVYNSGLEVLIDAPDFYAMPYHVSRLAPADLIKGLTDISKVAPKLKRDIYSAWK